MKLMIVPTTDTVRSPSLFTLFFWNSQGPGPKIFKLMLKFPLSY